MFGKKTFKVSDFFDIIWGGGARNKPYSEWKKSKMTPSDAKHFYSYSFFGDLVDTVIAPLGQIKHPVLYDGKNAPIENSEIVEFLSDRFVGGSFSDFLLRIGTDLRVYGNAAVIFLVDDSNKLLDYDVYDSSTLSKIDNTIAVRKDSGTKLFRFILESKGVWISKDNKNLRMCLIKDYSGGNTLAPPACSKIALELRYLVSLGMKNSEQLNSPFLDSIISVDEGLDDDTELRKFRDDLLNKNRSKEKSGEKISQGHDGIVIATRPVKVQRLTQNNKDGDYLNTASEYLKRCYNWAKIPLSLKLSEASTYNNVHTSKYLLISDATIPVLLQILRGMYGFLINYFPHEKGNLYFNEADIHTLQDKKVEETVSLFEAGIVGLEQAQTALNLPVDLSAEVNLLKKDELG